MPEELQPVYVNDYRLVMLVGTLCLFLSAAGLILLIFDYHWPLLVPGDPHGSLGYPILLCILFGCLMSYRTFVETKRIAFFDDHLTMRGFGRAVNIPYSELEVKPPRATNPKTGKTSNLRFRKKNQGRWIETRNPRLPSKENMYLYEFLGRDSSRKLD